MAPGVLLRVLEDKNGADTKASLADVREFVRGLRWGDATSVQAWREPGSPEVGVVSKVPCYGRIGFE